MKPEDVTVTDVKNGRSFHGSLDTPNPEDARAIRAKVLVCHGAVDPYVKPEAVHDFLEEMEAAEAAIATEGIDEIDAFEPELIGYSVVDQNLLPTHLLAGRLRGGRARQIAGGPTVSAAASYCRNRPRWPSGRRV